AEQRVGALFAHRSRLFADSCLSSCAPGQGPRAPDVLSLDAEAGAPVVGARHGLHLSPLGVIAAFAMLLALICMPGLTQAAVSSEGDTAVSVWLASRAGRIGDELALHNLSRLPPHWPPTRRRR